MTARSRLADAHDQWGLALWSLLLLLAAVLFGAGVVWVFGVIDVL